MTEGTIIFGWIGILMYISVFLFAQKLLKKGETALLHLLICFVFICWLPIPLNIYFLAQSQTFLFSVVFGYVFMIMLIITLAFQTSHLAYSNKQSRTELWNERDAWMLKGMLGDIYENLVNVLFNIWILLLAIGFFTEKEWMMGVLMTVFGLFLIRSVFLLLHDVMAKPNSFLGIFKKNPTITNIHTFLVFFILIIRLTIL
ncbi:MAG: hypothetical protein H0Z32_05220 [Bacillaceae bacterium]|nr:hypothetical protein [Bacillaceae bacterium]